MGEEPNTKPELGFNPAWWMAGAIALLLALVGVLVSTTLSTLWIFGCLLLAALFAGIGIVGIAHGRGYVFQSPLRLSAHSRSRTTASDWSTGIGLLIILFLVFQVGMFVGITRKPSAIDTYRFEREKKLRTEKQIPEPFSEEDQQILERTLTPLRFEQGDFRFQIIREEDERCQRFAESLSGVLKKSKWIEITPIAAPASGYSLPLGITIRSGTIAPASLATVTLHRALQDLGLHPDEKLDPSWRAYNYIVIYVSEHGDLPPD